MQLNESSRVAIVGAGHGGGTAAALLRQQAYGGEVVLIGDEPVGPYHRPPLSKRFLRGEPEQPLKPEQFYAEQGISLRVDTRVTGIDVANRSVELEDSERVSYDMLLLATGALPRPLRVPGAELRGVHELRTIADARVLKEVVQPGHRLIIVGGGYIGLEVAASAGQQGVDVTVIEREERVLARVASAALSEYVADCHQRQGTTILTSAQVAGFRGTDVAVAAVVLDDGREIPCDSALVGIGAVANDELARSAGLACHDGVLVDEHARTSDSAVYAVGDMTKRPLTFHQGVFRLESIPSAVEQARQAVAHMLGKPKPKSEVPWFWSDQFHLKLQIAGLLLDADTTTIRGHPESGKFSLFHTKHGRVLAVEAVSSPADFMAGKHLIRGATVVDMERLADASLSLRQVAA